MVTPTDEARAVLAIVVAFPGAAVVRTSRVVQAEYVRLAREGT